MDPALKVLLNLGKDHGVDIWVATNGIIVSGHTVGIVDFFDRLLTLSGMEGGEFREIYKESETIPDVKSEEHDGEDEHSPLVMFADAKIFFNGRYLCSGPVSLDSDLIAAWGPGLMTPTTGPTDYIPH